ncbi:MAG: dihydrofolate synthase/folylpolyglutamate synthase [Bacteroidia bacterium]|jgi:dihydrofolate synthase/folylpolyglutamate synthase
MYQRVGAAAYKKDLGNTIALCKALDNPHKNFKSIHIAGTNGKGSVAHMFASIFQENGYKTGLYTSPHLVDFRERIRINSEVVSEEFVVDFVARIKEVMEQLKPSFFEITVAMAFHYFSEQKVDIAIIETGLGGRLDSTNVITPELSVITNIGLDHTDMLGDTLPLIAVEKAGIIKKDIPAVIGERNEETDTVFIETAEKVKTSIIFAEDIVKPNKIWQTDLLGYYQLSNVRTTMAGLVSLNNSGWSLDIQKCRKGIRKVVENTSLMGRWQILQESPKVICDTGHNYDGLDHVVMQLEQESFDKLHIVFGQVEGKNTSALLSLLPKDAIYYFCKPDVVRGLDVDKLSEEALSHDLKGQTYPTVFQAYTAALIDAKPEDVVFVGGSTFVVADLLIGLNV